MLCSFIWRVASEMLYCFPGVFQKAAAFFPQLTINTLKLLGILSAILNFLGKVLCRKKGVLWRSLRIPSARRMTRQMSDHPTL